MGRFLSDLDRSREAVELLIDHFIDENFVAYELEGKEEQKFGDICLEQAEQIINVEVKYDIMAARTGNLCFEMSNGKKPTGIMTTKADRVLYVVPRKGFKEIFEFDPKELRKFIKGLPKKSIKKGGDGWRFKLAIVPIDNIIEKNIAIRKFEIKNA